MKGDKIMETRPIPTRRMKETQDNTDHSVRAITPYSVVSVLLLIILALLFTFPLYWILTGSFKTQQAVNSAVPVWFPTRDTLTMRNYNELFNRPALTWLINTVVICAGAMGLTCISAAMGGYALAKKKFFGRGISPETQEGISRFCMPKGMVDYQDKFKALLMKYKNVFVDDRYYAERVGWQNMSPMAIITIAQNLATITSAYVC